MTNPATTIEAPNGPAQLLTDVAKERFKLQYKGGTIFQGVVKVRRAETDCALKEAGVRLFVLSKHEGWDIVTQTIRVGVIGAASDDIVLLRGVVPAGVAGMLCRADHAPGDLAPAEADATAFYGLDDDWLLSIDAGCEGAFLSCANGKTKAEFAGDIVLRFRPWYRARLCVGESTPEQR